MRRAIGIDAIALELFDPPFVEPIGDRDADASVILVEADAFELHAFAVEEKARIFVEPDGANAKAGRYPVGDPAIDEELGFQLIHEWILERPEPSFADGELKGDLPRLPWPESELI